MMANRLGAARGLNTVITGEYGDGPSSAEDHTSGDRLSYILLRMFELD